MRIISLIVLIFSLLWTGKSLLSQTYYTVQNGNFNAASTWFNGLIPPTNLPNGAQVTIFHTITTAYNSTLNISGEFIIETNGYLNIKQLVTINNTGTIINKGGFDCDKGLDNNNQFTNSGSFYSKEHLSNLSGGNLSNTGTIEVKKNIENYGVIESTNSIISTQGELTNYADANILNYGSINIAFTIANSGSITNYGNINTSEIFYNYSVLLNYGNIEIAQKLQNFASNTNYGNIIALEVIDESYTCNFGNIAIDPNKKYECDGCTIDCGGLIIACEVEVKANSNISNQSFCCSDGTDPDFNFNTPYVFDSATIIICGVPLPIELISFTGWPTEEGNNHIQWITATEMDNDYFLLEKSLDGVTWTLVEKVQGAGFSANTLHYSVVDKNASFGKSYYRLIQVDFNGETHPYGPISVDQKYSKNNLICYPNPTNNQLFVLFNAQLEISEIQLKNAEGKEVISNYSLTSLSDQKIALDLSQLASGIYFLYYRGEVHRIVKT